MLYKCQTCKKYKQRSEVMKNGGNSFLCRECNTKHLYKYRGTESGRYNAYKAGKRSYRKHKDKQLARFELLKAIKENRVTRPLSCNVCKQNKKIEGHHTDYSKPLEVIWVCRTCHSDLHRKDVMLI